MDATFPTTSTLFTELSSNHYDIHQLSNAVDAARGYVGERSDLEHEPLFHLHTLTIETTLEPPQPFLHYYNQGHTENPDYLSFTSLRDTIQQNVNPFEPLIILPSTHRMLRIPQRQPHVRPGMDGSNGMGEVFLPDSHARRPLARLPQLMPKGGEEWLPASKAWDMQNWLQAAMALDPKAENSNRKGVYNDDKERFILRTGLQVCWVPDGEDENVGAEVKLVISVELLVDLTIAFEPLPPIGHDMRGLILYALLPAPVAPTSRSESDARAASLRFFYDSIKSAADLPFTFDTTRLQPKEMVSKLLPFQMRTLGLLLQRERSSMVGDVKPRIMDVAGVWTGVDLGGSYGKIAYRRMTGEAFRLEASLAGGSCNGKGKGRATDVGDEQVDGLTVSQHTTLPVLMDLSGVKGTMLCEEMGLGKTVEAIALLLLHRHPLSTARKDPMISNQSPKTSLDRKGKGKAQSDTPDRTSKSGPSPAVPVIDLFAGIPGLDKHYLREWAAAEKAAFAGKKAFDEEAQLYVSEVATTLIVTPPSLLRQWVSEMATHSPTLRVCVYEGWKTLQKGILKHHGDSVKAAEVRKRRQNEQFRAQTVRKYQKASSRERRVKIELSPDSEDSDAEEESEEDAVVGESSLEITQRKFVDYVRAHDVVITTYQDLSQDLKVAFPAPPRSRRSNAKYQLGERPRSPLIMVEWWRVIMDEVQLHGDQTDAANMVSLIPRVNSLAVSGTPAKTDIKDLMGSLKFLRVPVLPQDARLWHRLQQPSMRPAFKGLFASLAVRTTKKEVAGEFHLPSQSRFVVPVELSEIELHYYNDALDRQRDLLHLPGDPFRAIRNGIWVLNRPLFRSCLLTLRQICTHIQVGQMQQGQGRGGERLILGRELMTMSEALDKMRSDHVQEFLVESRLQMRAMIKKAQLIMLDENDQRRNINALTLYQRVRDRLLKQREQVRAHYKTLVGDHAESVDEDDSTPVRNLSQHERERRGAMTSAKTSLREMSIILHQTWFFEGDVHHALKEVEQETNCYSQADTIRKEILSRPLQSANVAMEQFPTEMAKLKGPRGCQDLITKDHHNKGGIVSDDTVTQANELLNILNGNAELIFAWRKKLMQLLCSPIEAESAEGQDIEDPEKEYYAEVLKAQGEIEAYLIAYAAVIADRREFILEERSLIQANDDKGKKKRTTKAAKEAAIGMQVDDAVDELAEQAGTLMAERQAFRDGRENKGCTRPLKALLMDLNAVVHGDHVRQEIAIAKGVASMLRAYIDEQSKHIANLLKEIDVFRMLFNRRVAYFAALQEISDSVAVPEIKDLNKEIADCATKINESEAKLTRMTIKGRFLQYLGTKEQGSDELREDCIICMGSSDDSHAIILECGHFFCNSCFKEFRKSTTGRKCPNCRIDINEKAMTKVKLAGADNQAEQQAAVKASLEGVDPQETGPSEPSVDKAVDEAPEEAEQKRRLAEMESLRMVDVPKRRDIASMDMLGEYGSKINFLIKHLLWYQKKEPGTRHVVFSNWSDSLDIVIRALKMNGIKFMSFESSQSSKRKDVVENFIKDISYTVFLLHAERESSGLTLTACRVVHLLEPVLKHSFELQAIGRVDRLGQEKETTVYCYATMETVESRILSQGARNGTSIYLKDEDSDEMVASMPNVPSAAHKGGDLSHDGNEEELLSLIL